MPLAACRKKQELTGANIPAPRRGLGISQESKEANDIVGRYLAGNFHERLDLWLTHRDLRPTLSRLDKAMRDE